MSDGRPFQGARVEGCEYFDDIMGDNDAPAIFDGQHSGMRDYDKILKKATPQGLVITGHCRGCNRDCQLLVGWDELYVVGALPMTGTILPKDWKISEVNHAPYPAVSCDGCQTLFGVLFPPDQAQKDLQAALTTNLCNPQWLKSQPAVQALDRLLAQRQQQR